MTNKKKKTSIQGVTLTPLTVHTDDRGYLTEIIHDYEIHKFGQVYFVGDLKANIVRAFHKHEKLWDWFFISHGSAKFILVDDREGSSTQDTMFSCVLGPRNMALLTVPPGIYHGWMSLEDDTQLISIASELYNRDNPDEVRISPYTFGDDLWEIKAK
jgi:dTDP-4-dehydrorhamnose 3,5-epimerase